MTLAWQIRNSNSYSVNVVWWVVGRTASGGPLVVPGNTTINFETPVDGPLPNTVAIMWIDPADGAAKTLSTLNTGVACAEASSTSTPTPSPTSGVLIPVTGIDLPGLFRDSMFLNLGIGIFGFALVLLGIGIKVDRDRWNKEGGD